MSKPKKLSVKTGETRTLILIAYLTSTFIYAINLWFSISGFYLLIATILILAYLIFSKKETFELKSFNFKQLLAITYLIFSFIAFTNYAIDIDSELSLAMAANRFLLFLNCLFAISYFFGSVNNNFFKYIFKKKYLVVLAINLLIFLTVIRVLKVPDIDVYRVLKFGPLRILEFKSPYDAPALNPAVSLSETNYYFYAYGPVSIYSFLPFNIILGDPRYLLVMAIFVTAFSIRKIAKQYGHDLETAELLSLIYLSNPRLIYFLQYSITDILIVSFIALGLFFLSKNKAGLLPIFLALAVGVKIFYILPYSLFLKNKQLLKIRYILIFLAFGFLFHLPFLVNNYESLYQSLFTLNTTSQPFLLGAGLTFKNLLDRQFHYILPQTVPYVIALFLMAIIWLIKPRSLSIAKTLLIISFAFTLLIFFGPIGNANYYFSASSFILFSLAFSGNKGKAQNL